MKTLLTYLFIASLCIPLYSCASYNLSYVKSAEIKPKPNKLYILVTDSIPSERYGINTSGSQNDFMVNLSKNISICLTQNGIKNRLKVHSEIYTLENDDDISLKIKNYEPDAVMNVKREQSLLLSGKYGTGYNGGIYTITITAMGDKKPYWKAIVETINEYYSSDAESTDLAKQVIDKLKADGII